MLCYAMLSLFHKMEGKRNDAKISLTLRFASSRIRAYI